MSDILKGLGRFCTADRVNRQLSSLAANLEKMQAKGFEVVVEDGEMDLTTSKARFVTVQKPRGAFITAYVTLWKRTRTSLTIMGNVQLSPGGEATTYSSVEDFLWALRTVREVA